MCLVVALALGARGSASESFILVVPFGLIGLIGFPIAFIKELVIFFCTECVLTDKRVLGKTGFISRDSLELLLAKVEGIHVKQGILGRIFDYGTVIVSGTGGSKTPFSGIARPLNFRTQVNKQIECVEK
jgi:uncharacterized membrane protein YdbT with pleckstrin-like domain